MKNLPAIASLWIGPELSFLEQLCLLSFLRQGHRVCLFHYDPVENVPDGIEQIDAREIHDPQQIIYNTQFQTPVPQSDVFRLQLLQQTEFIWVDCDVLALQPLPDIPYLFGDQGKGVLCNAVLRLPRGNEGLKDYADYTLDPYPILPWIEGPERDALEQQKRAGTLPHASAQKHSVYGPQVMRWFLQKHDLISHAKPREVFYPLPFRRAGDITDLHSAEFHEKYVKPETLAVHLWGRRARWWVKGAGVKRYSFLDRRLREFGINPRAAPLPVGRRR